MPTTPINIRFIKIKCKLLKINMVYPIIALPLQPNYLIQFNDKRNSKIF
jgi:hypothetical protein